MNYFYGVNKFCECILCGGLFVLTAVAFSAPIENPVLLQENKTEWHKLPSQQFVVFLDKKKVGNIQVYVKKKLKFREGMSVKDWQAYKQEEVLIYKFIRELKGKVSVFHSGANSLDYEIIFPRKDENLGENIHDANGDEWLGLIYPGFPLRGAANYVVSTEFYSASDDFNDYMIGFEQTYGTK